MPQPPTQRQVSDDVRRALAEDIGDGDRAAALVDPERRLQASVVCNDEAVLCGQPWLEETFRQLDPAVRTRWQRRDGDAIFPGDSVCRIAGPARALLSGERTALNFLQTLSGTASASRRLARMATGSATRVLDTRKTLPGLRLAQKYAVRCGGCDNHRMGLYDAVLIKENHIAACGSLRAALDAARRECAADGVAVQVEVTDMAELAEALDAGARSVLLDNFDPGALRQAVALTSERATLEASGGISPERPEQFAAVLASGVQRVSVGALTKHCRAVDFSMRCQPERAADRTERAAP